MSKDFPNELEEQADDDEASAQGEYSFAGLEIEFERGEKRIRQSFPMRKFRSV